MNTSLLSVMSGGWDGRLGSGEDQPLLQLLLGQELAVEEDQGVDDLLGVEDDVEGCGEIGLMPGLCQLLHL